MKQLKYLLFSILLIPTIVIGNTLTSQGSVVYSKQYIMQRQLEKAIENLRAVDPTIDNNLLQKLMSAFIEEKKYHEQHDLHAFNFIRPVYSEIQKKYGQHHPFTAFSASLLSKTYLIHGENEQALKYAKIAIHATNRKKPLSYYQILAEAYSGCSEYEKSIKIYHKLASAYLRKNKQGQYNTNLRKIYKKMANSYINIQQYHKALNAYHMALKVDNHSNISYYHTLVKMAKVYWKLQKWEQARHCYKQAIDYYREKKGENDSHVIYIENELGHLEYATKNYKEATGHYQKFLDNRELFSKKPAMISLAYMRVGEIYDQQGEYNLAKSNLEKAKQYMPVGIPHADIDMQITMLNKKINGSNDSNSLGEDSAKRHALLLFNKANAFLMQKDFQSAEKSYLQSLVILEKIAPSGQQRRFAYYGLAIIKTKQKHFSEAEKLLLKLLKIAEKQKGFKLYSDEIFLTYYLLGMEYIFLEQPEKAVQCLAKAVNISKVIHGSNSQTTQKVEKVYEAARKISSFTPKQRQVFMKKLIKHEFFIFI